MLPLKQPQAWLLMKFNFVPQDIFVLRYMRVYHKCHPNNKPCFDRSIHRQNGTHQIKVMINLATERILFLEKLESKTIVMLTGLCSLKNSISKVLFYNSITESRMSDYSISFENEKPLITEIRDIFAKTPDGTFDVIGKLKWVEEPRKVSCGIPSRNVSLEMQC